MTRDTSRDHLYTDAENREADLALAALAGGPQHPPLEEAAHAVKRAGHTLARIAGDVESDDLLFALGAVQTLRRDIGSLERAMVVALRERGESWATVGSALSITRQAAHERFGSAAS